MKTRFRICIALMIIALSIAAVATSHDAGSTRWKPQIKLVTPVTLPGSFTSSQLIYADSERIFAGSYQGDLFILERDRQANFPLIQTVRVGGSITAVRGDESNLYVTSRNGNLYIYAKSWPVELVQSMPLSNYGLNSLQISDKSLYVSKGQAAMTVSSDRVYISALNPGDVGIELPSQRSYGAQFARGATLVFDRVTFEPIGSIPNPGRSAVNVSTWRNFVYLTALGCCEMGISVYDATSLRQIQFINRQTNTVAGTSRKGVPLLVGGSESGAVDLYSLNPDSYELAGTADLPALTGFKKMEDIEIRALWTDGIDNLIFAGSSWGNDYSRRPELPSFFILEINFDIKPSACCDGRVS